MKNPLKIKHVVVWYYVNDPIVNRKSLVYILNQLKYTDHSHWNLFNYNNVLYNKVISCIIIIKSTCIFVLIIYYVENLYCILINVLKKNLYLEEWKLIIVKFINLPRRHVWWEHLWCQKYNFFWILHLFEKILSTVWIIHHYV